MPKERVYIRKSEYRVALIGTNGYHDNEVLRILPKTTKNELKILADCMRLNNCYDDVAYTIIRRMNELNKADEISSNFPPVKNPIFPRIVEV